MVVSDIRLPLWRLRLFSPSNPPMLGDFEIQFPQYWGLGGDLHFHSHQGDRLFYLAALASLSKLTGIWRLKVKLLSA